MTNTEPTGLPDIQAPVLPAAVPVDRAALLYLMQQFDAETWQCPQCGHAEDTATMDSANYLRRYLAENPAVAAPVAAAPTLDAELAQDRMSELCELERDVLDSLPAVYYMDPPDGGSVPLGEQVKRMAEDAALWRKHSNTPAAPGIDLNSAVAMAESLHWEVDPDNDDRGRRELEQIIRAALIDASPKGGSDASGDFGAMTDLLSRWHHNAGIEPSPNPVAKARREVWVQCLSELENALQATSAEAGS